MASSLAEQIAAAKLKLASPRPISPFSGALDPIPASPAPVSRPSLPDEPEKKDPLQGYRPKHGDIDLTPDARVGPWKVARDANGRILPGNSLNPSGRPRGATSIAKAILERAGGWEYLEAIVAGEVWCDPDLRAQITLKLVDRAYGKALERSVTLDATQVEEGVIPAAQLSPEELATFYLVSRRMQLPAGDVVDGEIVISGAENLPSTDPVTVTQSNT